MARRQNALSPRSPLSEFSVSGRRRLRGRRRRLSRGRFDRIAQGHQPAPCLHSSRKSPRSIDRWRSSGLRLGPLDGRLRRRRRMRRRESAKGDVNAVHRVAQSPSKAHKSRATRTEEAHKTCTGRRGVNPLGHSTLTQYNIMIIPRMHRER